MQRRGGGGIVPDLVYQPWGRQIGDAGELLPRDDVIHTDAPLELPLRPRDRGHVQDILRQNPSGDSQGAGAAVSLHRRLCRQALVEWSKLCHVGNEPNQVRMRAGELPTKQNPSRIIVSGVCDPRPICCRVRGLSAAKVIFPRADGFALKATG